MPSRGKHRLGLMVPPGNTTMEDDFARWRPGLVGVHVNRLYLPLESDQVTGLQSMGDHVAETTRLMARAPMDVIAFGCTSGSFLNGPGYDEQIVGRIEAASGGVPAVATARAVADALGDLGVKKIAACSPYLEQVNQRLIEFYSDAGFEVVGFDSVDPVNPPDPNELDGDVAFDLARAADRPDAEAIFIGCTAFRGAAEVIEDLEKATGKPVVTSNQAIFWACMREMDVDEPVAGAGTLLRDRVSV